MNDVSKPLLYLIIGSTGSGRRETLVDLIADGLGSEDRALVLLSENEVDSEHDEKFTELERWQWHDRGGGPEGMDGRIETEGLFIGDATHVFFVTDGRRNPVDQIEAVKPWMQSVGCEFARVLCVVNCKLASEHRELAAWYDACIHFSDIALLSRRDGVSNKWISDFQARYKDKFYPCLFEFVKDGHVKNPLLVLQPEPRRMSHYFDEAEYELAGGGDIEGEDEDEEEGEKDSQNTDEEIEVVEGTDEYMDRRAGGRRVKEIPDITKFLASDAGASE